MYNIPISTRLPDGYGDTDFSDILDRIKQETCIIYKDDAVRIKGYCDAWKMEKEGTTFNVVIVAMFGQISVTISKQSKT